MSTTAKTPMIQWLKKLPLSDEVAARISVASGRLPLATSASAVLMLARLAWSEVIVIASAAAVALLSKAAFTPAS